MKMVTIGIIATALICGVLGYKAGVKDQRTRQAETDAWNENSRRRAEINAERRSATPTLPRR